MSETLPIVPHPVEMRKYPPKEGRDLVMKERRENAKSLAFAANKIREAREMALKDVTTGLPNRLALETELPEVIKYALKCGEPLALMVVDVMGVKRTNDTDGHPVGDKLLNLVAYSFENILREDDIIYRIGGDEFAVLLLDYSPAEGQSEAELNEANINRIKSTFVKTAHDNGIPDERHVGLSIGIAMLNMNDDFSSLFERADREETIDHNKTYKELSDQGIVFQDRRLQP